MSHPNAVGLVELSRRTDSTIEDLQDIYGINRLIKINSKSTFHETCNRTLENRTIFTKYRFAIKEALVEIFNQFSEDEIIRMEKHACCELIIKNVATHLINKNVFGGRGARSRSEKCLTFDAISKVMECRNVRLKKEIVHSC